MREVREERRVVTALFADIVGSTALAERHDPEEARLIVGEAIARAVRIVEAFGGTVKDLAGDGMLALFGAPTAHEDDPERALRAALEIAAAITEYAVNVAARLQAAAEPGSVLAGPQARRLAELAFLWSEPRELALKGKAEPVAASEVLGISEGAGAVQPHIAPLTGRDAEMRELGQVLEGLRAGRGGVVFITGEPGIGKSRLTGEAHLLALDAGIAWLEGRAVSYGTALAWWPIRDLLRAWVGVGTQEPELRVRLALRRRLEGLVADGASSMAPYLGSVLGLAPDAEATAQMAGLAPETIQFQTYEALTDLVAALARQGPLVLAIDDLQWADHTTLGLCERLLPVTESLPLLLLFNHRPETSHASWALREKAVREFRHLVTITDLEPLSQDAERRLLRSLSEGALGTEAEDRVISLADGNPLYLEELARALGEGGTGPAIPSTLEGVITARLDRLEPAWRDLVTAASACGRSFSLGLVEAVSGLPEAELRPALHNLLRLDLLNEERRWPEPSYRFKHALIQEAAYRTLVRSRRQDLHSRAAAWLETRYKENPERVYGLLAHHWLEAAQSEQAARYLRLAGELALSEWSLDEAADHFRALATVLRQAGREAEAARPLFQLASTLHLAMRYSEANQAWVEAAPLWEPPVPGDAAPATFVMGVTRTPWDSDPMKGYYAMNKRLTDQLNDPLFMLRPGPSVEPYLAQRLEVEDDGLRYRIHLRGGLAYNSGRRLDADTVVASLREVIRVSPDATVLWTIRGAQRASESGDDSELGIRALDATTVEVDLEQRDPAFHFHLTPSHMGVVLPGEASGPFSIERMDEEITVITADPAYPRARTGNVRRAEWRPVAPQRAAEAVASGEIDALVSYGMLPAGTDLGLVDVTGPPVFVVSFVPSWTGPPVDLALRRALALALDRERLRDRLLLYQEVATGGVVPPAVPGHTPGIAPDFSPDEARRLLGASSHRGPLRVGYFEEAPYPALQAVLDCWQEVLGLDIERIPHPMREQRQRAQDLHVLQVNWIAHLPDPGYFVKGLFDSASLANYARVADPHLDELIQRAESAATGVERMAHYHEADRYLVADAAIVIPVFYAATVTLAQPWVQGWWEWGNPNQLLSELVITPDSPRYGVS